MAERRSGDTYGGGQIKKNTGKETNLVGAGIVCIGTCQKEQVCMNDDTLGGHFPFA
jgi:hypothetical protein